MLTELGPKSTQNDKGEFTEAQLTAKFVCTISPTSSSHTVPNNRRILGVPEPCVLYERLSQAKENTKILSSAKTHRRLWMQKATMRRICKCNMTLQPSRILVGLATRAELLRESVALARASRVVRWAGLPVTGICRNVLVAARSWRRCDTLAWTRPGHHQPGAAL